jgi:hypothetical protein
MSKEIRGQTEWEKKLSQLLWEYMEEKKKNPEGFLEISTVLMTGSKAWDVYMVSKQFWFIEWLIQNDKIDYKNLLENSNFIEIKSLGWGISYSLIMLLSIHDNPTKFLSEILKDE